MINIPYPLFSTAFCASTDNKEININDSNDSTGDDDDDDNVGDDGYDYDDDRFTDEDYIYFFSSIYLSIHLSIYLSILISYIQLEIFYHLVKTFHTRNHTEIENDDDNYNNDAHSL